MFNLPNFNNQDLQVIIITYPLQILSKKDKIKSDRKKNMMESVLMIKMLLIAIVAYDQNVSLGKD